jgi:hypothetical protein
MSTELRITLIVAVYLAGSGLAATSAGVLIAQLAPAHNAVPAMAVTAGLLAVQAGVHVMKLLPVAERIVDRLVPKRASDD